MLTGCYLGKLTRFMKLIQLHRVNYVVFFMWIQVADILRQKSRSFLITL